MEKDVILEELAKIDINILKVALIQARYLTMYGIDVSEKWDTALENSRDLEAAYNRGYTDAMNERNNRKAFDLHKQTSCPLDECVKALKMEDPIDYLKDKARVRGEKIKETELKLHPCTCGGEMKINKVARNGGMDGTYWDWELTCKKCGLTRIYAADDFYGRKYKTFEEVVDDWNRNKKKEKIIKADILDKIRGEIMAMSGDIETIADVLAIIDKCKSEEVRNNG